MVWCVASERATKRRSLTKTQGRARCFHRWWRASVGGIGREDADVRQIAKALGVVHAVADDEMIGDGETDILCLHTGHAALRLVEQRGDTQRFGMVLHE